MTNVTTPTLAETLKLAELQMAAEALFEFNAVTARGSLTPGQKTDLNRPLTSANLTTGNLHTNKFASSEVDLSKLTTDWIVVEHQSNTSTGFSGTLFKRTRDDALGGGRAGDLVLSLRSTEFIDDAARDNEATNKLEIADHGWAFGQIADMDNWYASLKSKRGQRHLIFRNH